MASELERLLALLAGPEATDRASAASALATLTEPAVPAALARALKTERDPTVLAALLRAMVSTGGARAAPSVGTFLTHADPRVRLAAVESVERLGDASLTARLEPLLADPDPLVRAAAARCCQVRGPVAGRAPAQIADAARRGELSAGEVRSLLQGQLEPEAAMSLMKAAVAMHLPDAMDLCLTRVQAPDPRVRLSVVDALAALGATDATAHLMLLVQDPDPAVSGLALSKLHGRSPAAAWDAVRPLLKSGQPRQVQRGLELVEALGDPGALPLVLDAPVAPTDASSLAVQSRLVLAWGTPAALDQLTEARRSARQKRASSQATARPGKDRASAPRARPEFTAAVPVLVGAVCLLLLVWGSMQGPSAHNQPALSERVIAPVPLPKTPQAALPAGALWSAERVSGTGGGPTTPAPLEDLLKTALARNRTPTLEEVAAGIARNLEAHGVRSKKLVAVLAAYHADFRPQAAQRRASELMAGRNARAAVDALEGALAEVEPAHLLGRIALLRQLISANQSLGGWARARELTARLNDAENEYAAVWLEAAQAAGLSADTATAVRESMEKSRARRDKAERLSAAFTRPDGSLR